MSLDEIIAHRTGFLTGYQSGRLAKRYRNLVNQVRDAATKGGYGDALPRAVAINYAKLLAYKDEYEVARLFTDGRFEKQLRDQFEGDFKFNFNLAPPILGGGVDALGRPKKRAFGAWMMPVFRTLAKLRFLRGTPLDIFGYSADRKLERDLIAGYEKDVATVLGLLSPVTHDTAVEILSLPDRIRGYGPVKEKAVADAKGALHATRRRPRQPATRATADRGGVGHLSGRGEHRHAEHRPERCVVAGPSHASRGQQRSYARCSDLIVRSMDHQSIHTSSLRSAGTHTA